LPTPDDPDLVVGIDHGDDALVWRRPDGRALVSTVDFFAPLVDDPATWGRIAAANAVSDVYAMGADPLFAVNIVGWPADLDPELLGQVMAGGSATAAEGGWVVAGGHTIDAPEPFYGQAVTGELNLNDLMTNDAAAPGDALVLTKPLGTGLVATAIKRLEVADAAPAGRIGPLVAEAIAEMSRLNRDAALVARRAGARAATDVTGFGLAGHLHKMMVASGAAAVLHWADLPLLDGVTRLVPEFQPGGTGRNLGWVGDALHVEGSAREAGARRALLGDPQTSGGLLVSLPPARAAAMVVELVASGHRAAVIGGVVEAGALEAEGGAVAGSVRVLDG
jgi:selenide,water dikinase